MQSGNIIENQNLKDVEKNMQKISNGVTGLTNGIGLFAVVVNHKAREFAYFEKKFGRRCYSALAGLFTGVLCYSNNVQGKTSLALGASLFCLAMSAIVYYEKNHEKHIVDALKQEQALVDAALKQDEEQRRSFNS